MIKPRMLIVAIGVCIGAFCLAVRAETTDVIRIGVIGPFSGPYAASGKQYRQGIEMYVQEHGSKVNGRDVQIIYRDVGGTSPAAAREIAQELILKDKVSMLGGFYLSPEASAVSSVITETRTPTVLFGASSPQVIRQSPYFVRVAATMWTSGVIAAEYGHKRSAKTAYTIVSDYSAGRDIEDAFKQKFTALGGRVIRSDRVPLNTVDYAAFAQRIADMKPDMVEMFLPAGTPAISFLKAMGDRGLLGGKLIVIGNNETDDPDLHLFPDSVIGTYTASNYATGVGNNVNEKLKSDLIAKYGPEAVPNFSMVGAYNGMELFYRMIAAQKGTMWNPDAAMSAVISYTWVSPSGPVKIGTDRNMTQNMFVRQVTKENGKLVNSVVSESEGVPDPWAVANPVH
ncbi:ABC transporter substrate-binding protein [Paraburkholderia sartisoli]|uniref:Amino acid/amide ABC transporter substrate-binding protein, HAAT family n=1 Tax=Paraburkholderia sartisoli TaxID=83784 RepID=A0A1H4GRN2_9BURK|nr:ABC transporter substrate-binding protein [Paraburkholderia sartisoli]SEB12194.1 amino acid/amide ABC transporter substrate-binding protein, HAAT family [Paraburkholderia sartisoli]